MSGFGQSSERNGLLGIELVESRLIRKNHVFLFAIDQMGGDRGQFLARLLQNYVQRGAAGDQATAAPGSSTSRKNAGVAMQHLHIRRGHPENVRGNLGKGCLRTLAMRRNPGVNRHLSC